MACFTFENKRVYYEEYGQGKPLVVLNGIMMSCASWKEFIEPWSANNRLILVDFLDQGKSDRMDGPFDQAIQAEVVKTLLDVLEIQKANIVGISYGSEVALRFAVKYGERVDRLMLFNATARTGPWLRDIGRGWNLAAHDPDAYYYSTIPIIYSPRFYREKNDWMNARHEILRPVFGSPNFIDAMIRLTNSSENYDVVDQIHTITAPTLVVSCQEDYLIPMAEQELICSKLPNAHRVIIPGSGHASMYEQPLLFTALVLGFCNSVKAEFHIV